LSQAVVTNEAPAPLSAAQQAARWSRHIGLLAMEPLILRQISAEQTIAEQTIQIAALQSAVLKLKHGK
jgi:hypothetical protein